MSAREIHTSISLLLSFFLQRTSQQQVFFAKFCVIRSVWLSVVVWWNHLTELFAWFCLSYLPASRPDTSISLLQRTSQKQVCLPNLVFFEVCLVNRCCLVVLFDKIICLVLSFLFASQPARHLDLTSPRSLKDQPAGSSGFIKTFSKAATIGLFAMFYLFTFFSTLISFLYMNL